MAIVNTESNVVFLFDRDVTSYADSEFEAAIKLHTSVDTNLVKASFGDAHTFAVPESQLQVQVSNKYLVIASAKIQTGSIFENTQLAKLAFELSAFFKSKELEHKSVAFNFVFSSEESEFQAFSSAIKESYFKDELIEEDETLRFAMPTISFEKNNIIFTLNYNAVDTTPDVDGERRVVIAVNVFFKIETLNGDDDVTNLFDKLKENYAYVLRRISTDE